MIFLKSITVELTLYGEDEKQLLCLFEMGLIVGEFPLEPGVGEIPLAKFLGLILGKP